MAPVHDLYGTNCSGTLHRQNILLIACWLVDNRSMQGISTKDKLVVSCVMLSMASPVVVHNSNAQQDMHRQQQQQARCV